MRPAWRPTDQEQKEKSQYDSVIGTEVNWLAGCGCIAWRHNDFDLHTSIECTVSGDRQSYRPFCWPKRALDASKAIFETESPGRRCQPRRGLRVE